MSATQGFEGRKAAWREIEAAKVRLIEGSH